MNRDCRLLPDTQYIPYSLYIRATALTLVCITLIFTMWGYMMYPGFSRWGGEAVILGEVSLALVPVILWGLWLGLTLSVQGVLLAPSWFLRLSNRLLYALFPLVRLVAYCGGYSKEEVLQSLIHAINTLVKRNLYKVEASRVLLLTPHCLQEASCIHKVTGNVRNCKQCGRCNIGDLLSLADEYACNFIVVTGGTLARMKVQELRPKAIIAIACERDLASGMADVFPIPVIGILNERPCGPCYNTQVDIEQVRRVVEQLVCKDKYDR